MSEYEDECWKDLLIDAMEITGEKLEDIIHEFPKGALNRPFDKRVNGSPMLQGRRFTVWTGKYVYFPLTYDCQEWVGFAPRDPSNHAMIHQGDGDTELFWMEMYSRI